MAEETAISLTNKTKNSYIIEDIIFTVIDEFKNITKDFVMENGNIYWMKLTAKIISKGKQWILQV